MGYIQLAIVAVVMLFGVRLWHKYETAAKTAGIAKAEKQIAESVADANKDAAREMAVLLSKRADRFKAQAKATALRKATNVKQKTVDPVYRNWADEPVPQYVVDRLRAGADASGGVRQPTSDEQSRPAMQTDSTATTVKDDKRGLGQLRLGPARPNP